MEDKMAAGAFGRARNYGCGGPFNETSKSYITFKRYDKQAALSLALPGRGFLQEKPTSAKMIFVDVVLLDYGKLYLSGADLVCSKLFEI